MLKYKKNTFIYAVYTFFLFTSLAVSAPYSSQDIVIHNMSHYPVELTESQLYRMSMPLISPIQPGQSGILHVRVEPGFWYNNPPDATFYLRLQSDQSILSLAANWSTNIDFDQLTPSEDNYQVTYTRLQNHTSHVNMNISIQEGEGVGFSSVPIVILVNENTL